MATYKTLVNLTQRNIPAFPYERRRTAMVANVQGDLIQPYVYWLENVIPIVKGYKSVEWVAGPPIAIEHPSGLPSTFYKFPTENKGIMQGIYSGDVLKIFIPEKNEWKTVFTLNEPERLPTTAYIQNRSYVFAPGETLKTLNDADLEDLTLKWGTGVTPPTDIIGIAGVQGYLILYSQKTLYWSSPLDPTVFNPSDENGVSTGAGSTEIQGLTGQIISVNPIAGGAIVYTNTMAFAMRYTSNALIPWAFAQVPLAGGVIRQWHIANDLDSEIHYVWTVVGLQKISLTRAENFEVEFNEMFSREALTTLDRTTREITETATKTDVRLTLLGSNWLAVSQGPNQQPFSECWIYNFDLQRWGRLAMSHWHLGNKIPLTDVSKPTWGDLIQRQVKLKDILPFTYASLLGDVLYSSQRPLEFMALTADGNLIYSDWAEKSKTADAFVMIGDFRVTLGSLTEVINTRVGWTNDDFAQILGINEWRQEVEFVKNPWSHGEYTGRILGRSVSMVVYGNFELTDFEVEVQRL